MFCGALLSISTAGDSLASPSRDVGCAANNVLLQIAIDVVGFGDNGRRRSIRHGMLSDRCDACFAAPAE